MLSTYNSTNNYYNIIHHLQQCKLKVLSDSELAVVISLLKYCKYYIILEEHFTVIMFLAILCLFQTVYVFMYIILYVTIKLSFHVNVVYVTQTKLYV